MLLIYPLNLVVLFFDLVVNSVQAVEESTLLFTPDYAAQEPVFADMSAGTAARGTGSLNVFKQPLALLSKSPMTGYHRDGYCRTSPTDYGHHALAAELSDEFLDFTASKGNDLRAGGLKPGCKWCLCTGRWLEVLRASRGGEVPESAVPRVFLQATEDSVLSKGVDMADLKRFAKT